MKPKWVDLLSEIMPFAAFIVGIATSIMLIFAHFSLLDHIFELVPNYKPDEPPMLPSFPLLVISIMLGTRVGRAMYYSNWKGNVSDKGEIQFLSCLIGFSIYSVVTILIYLATDGMEFGATGIMYIVLNIAAMFGIGWAMQQWHDKRMSKLEKYILANENSHEFD